MITNRSYVIAASSNSVLNSNSFSIIYMQFFVNQFNTSGGFHREYALPTYNDVS